MSNAIGKYINSLRRKKKMTLEALAKLSGVSPCHISRVEQGLRNPSALTLRPLAKPLGVSVEDLYRRACYLEKLPVNKLSSTTWHPVCGQQVQPKARAVIAHILHGCLCGKRMNLLVSGEKIAVWACPPSGCGRLYIECEGVEVSTYYLAEQNCSRSTLK